MLVFLLGVFLASVVPNGVIASLCFISGLVAYAVLLLMGMAAWAKAKGYDPFYGIVLGLFCSFMGLVILMILPDRSF